MVTAVSNGRRRSSSPTEEDYSIPADYKPYVPVAKRRAQLLNQIGTKHQVKKVKTAEEVEAELREAKEEAEDEERRREKARRERTLLQAAQEVKERKAAEGRSGSSREKCA